METLEMSPRERRRLEAFSRVQRGELSIVEAAALLTLSYRQARRVYQRYIEAGDQGLVHRLRGKPSNRRPSVERKDRVIERYREIYVGFGPTLAAEYLARDSSDLQVPVETLRQWLLGADLWTPRSRRAKHRTRRPRRSHAGELVQMDGSPHDWFEGRRDWATLMVMIDDATGRVLARFFEEETLAAAMEMFGLYVGQHGLPRALYVDRDSIYRSDREPTADETLAGDVPLTQFGRAMHELDVELILAGSPQAKGRVERSHGTHQDRLVKGLRRAGIRDLDAANGYLEREYLPDFQQRFSVPATNRADFHRRLPRGVNLALVLAVHEERVVRNDWTLRWKNRWLQLTAANQDLPLVGRRVTVCEQLDGQIRVLYGKRILEWRAITAPPTKPKKAPTGPTGSSQGQRPAADHPWRGAGRSKPKPR